LIFYLFKKSFRRYVHLFSLVRSVIRCTCCIRYTFFLTVQNLIARYEISLLEALSFFLFSSLAVSVLSYHVIEKPALKLGRKVIGNL
jgi:hypothetical protein